MAPKSKCEHLKIAFFFLPIFFPPKFSDRSYCNACKNFKDRNPQDHLVTLLAKLEADAEAWCVISCARISFRRMSNASSRPS